MANVILNDTHLVNIANAIREKNGSEDTYTPGAMADAIAAIEVGGGEGFKTARVETYGDEEGAGFGLYDKDENWKGYCITNTADNGLTTELMNDETGDIDYTIAVEGDYMTSIADNSTGKTIDLNIGTENEYVYSSNPVVAYQNGLVSGLVAYTIGGGSSSASGGDLPAAEEVEF